MRRDSDSWFLADGNEIVEEGVLEMESFLKGRIDERWQLITHEVFIYAHVTCKYIHYYLNTPDTTCGIST